MPFRMIRADLTTLRVDAIVNAANNRLQMGGGVCGAIFRAAGAEKLQAACDRIGHCDTGRAVITPGFHLPSRNVIHTVGPVWHGGAHGEEELLRACYQSCLQLAAQHKLRSLAFPLISAGIYGYPRLEAIQVAVDTISTYLLAPDSPDLEVTLVLYDHCSYRDGSSLYGRIASYLSDNDASYLRYEEERHFRRLNQAFPAVGHAMPTAPGCPDALPRTAPLDEPREKGDFSLADKLFTWAGDRFRREETFSQCLMRFIDRSGEKDSTIYKRANIDRRLFSKIRSNPHYQPAKSTVLAFCLALHLSMDDAQELLRRAGYALTRTSRLDLAVEYCLRCGIYDVHQINIALFELDLDPLGA